MPYFGMDDDTFKPVPGYVGLYSVSSRGGVFSVPRIIKASNGVPRQIHGCHLKPDVIKTGYEIVRLARGGANRPFPVHRLVLMAWVGIPPVGYVANHKNGIKNDNRLENLEWTTLSGNVRHAERTGLKPSIKGSANPKAKLTTAQVEDIRARPRLRGYCKPLAAEFGISLVTLSRIVNGRAWRAENDDMHADTPPA